MSESTIAPFARFALATVVHSRAIDSLLEAGTDGRYRDATPWLVAQQLVLATQREGLRLAILFARTEDGGPECEFCHYSSVRDIDVVELHRGQWESRLQFGALQTMHPIWQSLDSVFHKPSAEQLEREASEGLRVHRYALTASTIRPYAICETPAFLLDES